MLLEGQLPPRFWAEAVNTAVYLLNRSPTKAPSTTSLEAWYGRRPALIHLRRFRRDPDLHVPDALCLKLDSKTWRSVLQGYVHNITKLWLLWDTWRQRVVNGPSVCFDKAGFRGRTLEETPVLLKEDVGEATRLEKLVGAHWRCLGGLSEGKHLR